MSWNMHLPKLGDRKYNSLNCSDESEVVDKWWNVILNAARGHPCKGRNKMIHSFSAESKLGTIWTASWVLIVVVSTFFHKEELSKWRTVFSNTKLKMCIYWLTSLESKGAAAPRIPCACVPDLKLGRGYSTQPTTLQAVSPHTKDFLQTNNEYPCTTRHGETFQHELNGEGFGFRDAEKSFPWFYISVGQVPSLEA